MRKITQEEFDSVEPSRLGGLRTALKATTPTLR